MILIKYSELERIIFNIQKLMKNEMPIKTVIYFTRLHKKIQEEYKIYSEQLNKILDKYGRKDQNNQLIIEEGNSSNKIIKPKEGFELEFIGKINELNDIEFNLDSEPISIDDLQIEKIEGSVILALEKFIK
ncbi:MAG: hypothetical protein GX660_21850 [Clostridiaceae bacterium]|nr:hypothetical protein [Clostridiaceae bacterium]